MTDNKNKKIYEAVVIGASAGGLNALQNILSSLSDRFTTPIIIVQHQHPESKNLLVGILQNKCKLKVKEAMDKELVESGTVYIAPPAYHLLIEEDKTFSLSLSEPVNFARPSIDVLFETAAEVYREKLIGVILTGANSDGADGLKKIKDFGGVAIVQNPKSSEESSMPNAAIEKVKKLDSILEIKEIGPFLQKITD